MYFEKGQRYFNRNGEYEVIAVGLGRLSNLIGFRYITEVHMARHIGEADILRVIDINVRAERKMADFLQYCREHSFIFADLSKDQLEPFCQRYEKVTGSKLEVKYGLYIRKPGPGVHSSLIISLPKNSLGVIPTFLHASLSGKGEERVHIYNTKFVWSLFERGFRIGNQRLNKTRKPAALPAIPFGLKFGVGQDKLLKFLKVHEEAENTLGDKLFKTASRVMSSFSAEEYAADFNTGRLRNLDGSISPVEDTGFRFRRAA